MTACDEIRAKIHLYIDNELAAGDSMTVEAHLLDCRECRAEYDTVRAVVDTVRGARPLYEASEGAAQGVRALVDAHRRKRVMFKWLQTAAVTAALLMVTALWWWQRHAFEEDHFAAFAVDTHLRYAGGMFPLDVNSSEPGAISEWLQRRLPFHVVLPDYPADFGRSKRYVLVGARLLQHDDKDLAYVVYRIENHPISLFIASSQHQLPAAGKRLQSGRLTFHASSRKGLDVIAWTDRGLGYALVSDITQGRAEACVVCHGSAAERRKFEQLSPATRQ